MQQISDLEQSQGVQQQRQCDHAQMQLQQYEQIKCPLEA